MAFCKGKGKTLKDTGCCELLAWLLSEQHTVHNYTLMAAVCGSTLPTLQSVDCHYYVAQSGSSPDLLRVSLLPHFCPDELLVDQASIACKGVGYLPLHGTGSSIGGGATCNMTTTAAVHTYTHHHCIHCP